MAWLQLDVTLNADAAECVETALLAAGALSVTCLDAANHPLYEPDPQHPPIWPQTRVNALFAAATDRDAIRAVLAATLGALPPHEISILEDREWTREWLKDFRPMRFGRRLWIVPSTYEPPDAGAVNIRLDPGLAFGTGTHPTTALCLEWLDAADLNGRTVIDYGCGSGILAVAAARLGAAKVWATDNDPQALLATRENAVHNRVSNLIHTSVPEVCPMSHADVLLANILAAPLCTLAPRFASLIKSGGQIVLSGILENQQQDIRNAYAKDFRIVHVAQRLEWLRMDAQRLGRAR